MSLKIDQDHSRFRNIVRHDDHCLVQPGVQAEELILQHLARSRIERAETGDTVVTAGSVLRLR